MVSQIMFTRYRSFEEAQNIKLRPITLLYGHNSAGKSAALRLVPILAAAIRSRKRRDMVPAVFDYESPALRGAAFNNLVCSKYPGGSITVGFDWGLFSYQFSVKEFSKSEGEFITQFKISSPESEIYGSISETNKDYTHDLRAEDSEELSGKARLLGLVPTCSNANHSLFDKYLRLVEDELDSFSDRVRWLGATRVVPPRSYRYGPGSRLSIDFDGTGVAQVLRASAIHDDGVAVSASQWLKKTCGCELAIEKTDLQGVAGNEMFSFNLRSLQGSYLVSIQDVGEGIAQALPIVTLCHQARIGLLGKEPVLAMEQPELHLHPRAEIILADEIASCVSAGSDATHLIETHSESVLLSMQLAIVRKQIRHTDLVVYWVEQTAGASTLTEITFDESGFPNGGWPTGVFRESLEQARQLASLRVRLS